MSGLKKYLSPKECLRVRLTSLIPRIDRYAVFEINRQDVIPSLPKSPGIRIERVTNENVGLILHFREQKVVKYFKQYLASGDIGVYAFSGDQTVGHAWAALAVNSKRIVWDYMKLVPKEACICFCSVDPNYRGRKIYQNMLAELIGIVFSSTDVFRILIDSDIHNAASLAAINRSGFRPLGVLPVFRWRNNALPLRSIQRTG